MKGFLACPSLCGACASYRLCFCIQVCAACPCSLRATCCLRSVPTCRVCLVPPSPATQVPCRPATFEELAAVHDRQLILDVRAAADSLAGDPGRRLVVKMMGAQGTHVAGWAGGGWVGGWVVDEMLLGGRGPGGRTASTIAAAATPGCQQRDMHNGQSLGIAHCMPVVPVTTASNSSTCALHRLVCLLVFAAASRGHGGW
jgi:hypothetical protein